MKLDVRERPDLARKYGIAVVPTVLAVAADGRVLERLAPTAGVRRLRRLGSADGPRHRRTRRPGDGREQGDRPRRSPGRSPPRAPGSRSPAAAASGSTRPPPSSAGDVTGFVADAGDLDAARGASGRGRGGARPDRHPRHQHRRPAPRRRARQLDRGVGSGLSVAGARRAGAGRRVRAGDARAGLGTDRQRRLQLDGRADPLDHPLQLGPPGGGRLPEDALARGRRRRGHRQHRRHRQIRHRPARRKRGLAGERRTRVRARPCPPAASACPEEFGDLVAFLASDRAAYITGTAIPIDGGFLQLGLTAAGPPSACAARSSTATADASRRQRHPRLVATPQAESSRIAGR